MTIEGVTTNNLQERRRAFPLGALRLRDRRERLGQELADQRDAGPALIRRAGRRGAPSRAVHRSLRGASQIDKVVEIDQSPIGRTPRSNPATYTGAFDEIRKVFANTREAKQRGYKASRFSFNVKGGRCEECQGQGVAEDRDELPARPVRHLQRMRGRRFNRQTLEVRYRGKSIADVLGMSVDEAVGFFENFPPSTGSSRACRMWGWAT
jgi:excinuclease ABC subunit A